VTNHAAPKPTPRQIKLAKRIHKLAFQDHRPYGLRYFTDTIGNWLERQRAHVALLREGKPGSELPITLDRPLRLDETIVLLSALHDAVWDRAGGWIVPAEKADDPNNLPDSCMFRIVQAGVLEMTAGREHVLSGMIDEAKRWIVPAAKPQEKAQSRPKESPQWLVDLAEKAEGFGSSPGGPGVAGQGKACPSRENAAEKVRCAGAHFAASPNENGAETPAEVRTDGAQVRSESMEGAQSPKTDKPARWFGRGNWIHGVGPTGPFIFKVPPPKAASKRPYALTSDVVLSWIGDDILDDLDSLAKEEDRYRRIDLSLRVWRTYPVDVFDIGCRGKETRSGWAALGVYRLLNELHQAATACLMMEANGYGLDPAPLGESAEIKAELYADEPWRYFGGRIAAWPDCMGKALDSLTASKQQAIREAENVLRRLEVKVQAEFHKSAEGESTNAANGPKTKHHADTPESATAGRTPEKIGPRDQTILDMLYKLPLHWGTIDANILTATEQEALNLLTRAGLAELRIRLRGSMQGFQQWAEMQFAVSGEYRKAELINELLHAVPEWLDADGKTRGRFTCESDGLLGVRLTDQGEQAKHDYDNNTPDSPSFVLAFVRGTGPMGLPRPRVDGTVIVECCRVQKTAQEDDRPAKGASGEKPPPAASANATVGDITVHNHVTIDAGAIADLVLKRLAEQQAPPAAVPASDAVAPLNSIKTPQGIALDAGALARDLETWAGRLSGSTGGDWQWALVYENFRGLFEGRIMSFVNRPGDAMTRQRLEDRYKQALAAIEEMDRQCTVPGLPWGDDVGPDDPEGALGCGHLLAHVSAFDDARMAATDSIREVRRCIYELCVVLDGFTHVGAANTRDSSSSVPSCNGGNSGQTAPVGQEDAQASPLPDRARTAYDQYLRAVPECTGKDGRAPTDQQCHEWLKAHNDGDTLPGFDTWQRYVRQARKHLGKQKNAPRAGRSFGRSIVPAKNIEPPEAEEAD
jgi:hypothetical protein